VLISLLKVLQSSDESVDPGNSSDSAAVSDSTETTHGCCTLALQLVTDILQSRHMAGPAAAAVAVNISMLPWLVLLGRCCLYVSAQTTSSDTMGSTTDGSSSSSTEARTEAVVQGKAEEGSTAKDLLAQDLLQLFAACADALKAADDWLQHITSSGMVSAQLAAAGYITEDLHSQIQQAEAALMPTAAAAAATVAAGGAVQSTSQTAPATTAAPACLNSSFLTSLGLALNSLPVPSACNNPSCRNLSRLSELQLVNGRTCMCAGCR